MARGTILRGTLILLAAGLFTRILGFFYRLALSRLIGAEGMGLIQMVVPVLFLGVGLATAGIPVAVSKLVAERQVQGREREIKGLLHAALFLSTGVGLLFAVLLFALARTVADHFLTDSRTYLPLLCLIPAIIFISISAVLRGYFQGLQRMTPPATAQGLEQIIRLAAVLVILPFFLPFGIGYAAAGAIIGLAVGELGSLLVLLSFYYAKPPPAESSDQAGVTKEIVSISLPITITRLISSLGEILDVVIIPRRLESIGFSRDQSTAFFGVLSGMAVPLLLFPTVLTFSLASALVPSISEAAALDDLPAVRRRTQQALHITLLIGLPLSATFLVLGGPLGLLFYGSSQVGNFLRILALGSPFIYLEQGLTAVFRGLGKATIPMLNGLVGSGLRLVLIYFTTPVLGVSAVLWAVVLDLALCFALNYWSLRKLIGSFLDLPRQAGTPLLACAWMAFCMHITYLQTQGQGLLPACLWSLGLGGVAYLLVLAVTRSLPPLGGWKK